MRNERGVTLQRCAKCGEFDDPLGVRCACDEGAPESGLEREKELTVSDLIALLNLQPQGNRIMVDIDEEFIDVVGCEASDPPGMTFLRARGR